jgi:HAD superfamily hydrolase (TIGR01509 family)
MTMSLDPTLIRAICFDIDGTLNDIDDVMVERLEKTFRPLRRILPRRDTRLLARRLVMWAESPGNFFLSLPDTLGLDQGLVAISEWLNRRRLRPKRNFRLIPGIREMLTFLATRYPLAVVSARDEAGSRAFLQCFNLEPYFQVIVTGQTARHTKPYPDPILYAANAMHVSPGACLMVGDTTVDVISARRAGAQAVGVLCGLGEAGELKRAGAALLLDSTSDLPQTLLP